MTLAIFLLIIVAIILFKPSMCFQFDKDQTIRLKGILAVLIVMYHTMRGIIIVENWGYVIVSMFMFVTGYGLMASYANKGEVYLQTYFRHRFLKLLPPLVLATTGFMIIEYLAGHGSFMHWFNYFKQTGIPPYWCNMVCLLHHILLSVLLHFHENRKSQNYKDSPINHLVHPICCLYQIYCKMG